MKSLFLAAIAALTLSLWIACDPETYELTGKEQAACPSCPTQTADAGPVSQTDAGTCSETDTGVCTETDEGTCQSGGCCGNTTTINNVDNSVHIINSGNTTTTTTTDGRVITVTKDSNNQVITTTTQNTDNSKTEKTVVRDSNNKIVTTTETTTYTDGSTLTIQDSGNTTTNGCEPVVQEKEGKICYQDCGSDGEVVIDCRTNEADFPKCGDGKCSFIYHIEGTSDATGGEGNLVLKEETCETCPGDCGHCQPTCTPTTEICDGKDNDCDGQNDEDGVCDPVCAPAEEICDGKDNDCDGEIDEGCEPEPECGDGFCAPDEDCDVCPTDCGECAQTGCHGLWIRFQDWSAVESCKSWNANGTQKDYVGSADLPATGWLHTKSGACSVTCYDGDGTVVPTEVSGVSRPGQSDVERWYQVGCSRLPDHPADEEDQAGGAHDGRCENPIQP